MNTLPQRPSATRYPLGRAVTFGLGSLAALFAACHKGSVARPVSGLATGSVALHPGQGPSGSLSFVVEPNSGGRATTVRVRGLRWGKLADVRDSGGFLRHQDFVVDEELATNSDYLVESNPITGKTTVTIQAPYDASPSSVYAQKLAGLEAELTILEDKSLAPTELPPYPLVPRNATLVIEFDDLLDPATINADTIKVLKGYPPTTPFDARLFADPNHGDLAEFDGAPGLEFYTTRVIVDTTVSVTEAATTNPPLPVNAVGLPPSITQAQPNVAVRIPTRLDPFTGQASLLKNLTNHGLSTSQSGSVDATVGTQDVVRALRSGGSAVGDLNNGFLLDTDQPAVIGTQAAFLQNLAAGPAPQTFVCDLVFALPSCAGRLVAGDVIQQGGVYAEVICPPFQTCSAGAFVSGPAAAGVVSAVYFRIIAANPGGPQTLEAGSVQLSLRYHANVPSALAPCFVRFTQATLPPDQGVAPTSPVILRFSEAMDPATLRPFDSFMLLRRDPVVTTNLNPYDYVVGSIQESTDLREFTFRPTLPLNHLANTTESYWTQVVGGLVGGKDLSGNSIAAIPPPVRFRIDAAASAQNTSGFAMRFTSLDELASIGGATTGAESTAGVGKREWRGQFLINAEAQKLLPRPVTHFTAAADRSQPWANQMPLIAGGTQTPISKLGSKMQTIWRYFDVGFGLLDEANYNVDVEGLAWSPLGSSVVADNITRFEMSLAHSIRVPDETFNPQTQQAVFPNSGIVAQFSQNLLSAAQDPLKHVYPLTGGPSGYSVIPTDLFQGPTGTRFMPWPMNRNTPARNFAFYTWRDTSITVLGGPQTSGANPLIWYTAQGLPPPVDANGNFDPIFDPNQIPSYGMSLLMEFRCYPDDEALGLNLFDVAMSTPVVFVPNFRAFSTGGVNTQNQIVRKDPDLQTVATGGFNPASTPTPGQPTLPVDNTFYMGQLSLVTRLSRVHSIWFDSTTGTVQYATPVLEPSQNLQPDGTSIVFHYRGASQITNTVLTTDSIGIDVFGNRITTGTPPLGGTSDPIFFNGDNTWKDSLSALNGARFFQIRATFLSNAETNLSPEMSSLGIAYRR